MRLDVIDYRAVRCRVLADQENACLLAGVEVTLENLGPELAPFGCLVPLPPRLRLVALAKAVALLITLALIVERELL